MIKVLMVGLAATVQDLGRPGLAHMAVPAGGAFDRAALCLANRLVGNDESAAGLEVTAGGLAISTSKQLTIAVAGAPCVVAVNRSTAVKGGTAEEEGPAVAEGPAEAGARCYWVGESINVPQSSTVALSRPTAGLRSYVAVRGGIDVEPVLGSRSTDTLGNLGPPALKVGDVVSVGSETVGLPSSVKVTIVDPGSKVELAAFVGPRHDWLSDVGARRLSAERFLVTDDVNRTGIRLSGLPLELSRRGELKPEAVIRGAVQVPPDGQPIIFGVDHPTTGGYPVVAVVADRELSKLAQLRPGNSVLFMGV